MKLAGRIAAAIEVLSDFDARRVPLKTALADWARGARYAGAKDRAYISGLCLDVLRRRNSLSAAMQSESPRALIFAALSWIWAIPLEELAAAALEEPHGPGGLTDEEQTALMRGDFLKEAFTDSLAPFTAGDYPEWLHPSLARIFGDDAPAIMHDMATRADVDLRLNTLKAEPEKSLKALKSVRGHKVDPLITAARIDAPAAADRAPGVSVIPAFNKGWVEVQDLGSQIAASAAGAIKGAQVLDYCAGGGGKTLALAAMMENTGQLYAYDLDARRLKPLYHRAQRAGLRNLQIRSRAAVEGPKDEILNDLIGAMDVVFVDAPCSGSGTWRRHPDTKWRLTKAQLEKRVLEQRAVLREAASFLKPGGRLVYVTCSILPEENEDQIEAFLNEHASYRLTGALDQIEGSGLLTEDGRASLAPCQDQKGMMRLGPPHLKADGFFVAVLENLPA